MAVSENEVSGSESKTSLWISAAQESLRLCWKCSGLAKQSSTLQDLLSPNGLQIRTELGYLRDSARRGCPFCSIVSDKLNYGLENTPELQVLRKRSRRIFCHNLIRRQNRSYRPGKFLYLRMRAPWNDYSDKNEPLMDDFEGIEMHYKIPKQIQLENALKGEDRWKRLLEFDVCATDGKLPIFLKKKS